MLGGMKAPVGGRHPVRRADEPRAGQNEHDDDRNLDDDDHVIDARGFVNADGKLGLAGAILAYG